MGRWILGGLVAAAGLMACADDPVSPPAAGFRVEQRDGTYVAVDADKDLFSLSVAKWPGGRAAAVTITYDAPWGTHRDHHLATDAAIARGLSMDIEMVTWIFTQPERAPLLEVYREELVPHGIGFFGHGHTHALHDTMTYEEAYASFSTCFDLMEAWGFRPRAYAYPGSSALLAGTQRANREAGFICARGSTLDPSTWNLLAGENPQTPNWHYLPAVPLGNGSYRYIQNHGELAPVLDKALSLGSWVILMYHAIGIPEGWGYYPYTEFVADLDQIAGGDFWSANLDRAAAYARQRIGLTLELTPGPGRTYRMALSDGLPDETYDEPLTVTLHLLGLTARQVVVGAPVGTGVPVAVAGDSVRLQLLPAESEVLLSLE